ncbi:hypothetical protein Taro_040254, partial [Colocasia esculenta]|nr:hypothetical protein [Colocasia esculenta]
LLPKSTSSLSLSLSRRLQWDATDATASSFCTTKSVVDTATCAVDTTTSTAVSSSANHRYDLSFPYAPPPPASDVAPPPPTPSSSAVGLCRWTRLYY